MKRRLYMIGGLAAAVFLFFAAPVGAQMMGGFQGQAAPSQSELQDEANMQSAGQAVYKNLQSGKTSCQALTNDDYEKLGEYYMGLAAGSTQNYVYWDNMIQQMMGDQGDTNVHIVWGQRGSGCQTNASIPANTPSFISGMMGYQPAATDGSGTMMNGYYRTAAWSGTDTLLAVLLVLVGAVAVFAWLRPLHGSRPTKKEKVGRDPKD